MDRTIIPDHLSAKGAAEMAERIEAYWNRQGYAVTCRDLRRVSSLRFCSEVSPVIASL
jgi:hypothetical protein